MQHILKTTLILCCLIASMNIYAQKTALVDYSAILYSMPETKAADSAVRAEKMQLAQILQRKQIDFENKYNLYDSTYNKMSKAVQAFQKSDLEKMKAEYDQFLNQADSIIKSRVSSLMQPIYLKLNNAIGEVAKSNKIAQIWDTQTTGLMYFDKALNISQDVKKYLKIN
ncbi:MAG: OmpH family outer membrane protein [Bacteroidetes bacterium]|nr:OmpH family outer membrane protein [Bacteroidota bacterium]